MKENNMLLKKPQRFTASLIFTFFLFISFSSYTHAQNSFSTSNHSEIDCGEFGYPVRSANKWWSVLGDRNPSKDKIIEHILNHENHVEQIKLEEHREWIKELEFPALMSLHSDLHEEEKGSVFWECIGSDY